MIHREGCGTTADNAAPQGVVAPETGTYVLVYAAHNGLPPHDYTFRLSVTA